jgi:hypothetical protein
MATAMNSCVQQIGETAGLVWRVLSESGPTPMAKLLKSVDAPRDSVQQAIGWLAREGKIEIEEQGRTKVVSLDDAGY